MELRGKARHLKIHVYVPIYKFNLDLKINLKFNGNGNACQRKEKSLKIEIASFFVIHAHGHVGDSQIYSSSGLGRIRTYSTDTLK